MNKLCCVIHPAWCCYKCGWKMCWTCWEDSFDGAGNCHLIDSPECAESYEVHYVP